LYNSQKFDLVINDGDMGSNVLAEKRGIKSVFATNQFRPKLCRSHFFFYPSLMYISKQIAKATKIVVADSAPPNTICEYNLNFPDEVKQKVVYAGHFSNGVVTNRKPKTDLERLIENTDFGYWMQTGNKSTKEFTGKKYEETLHSEEMQNQKRLVSHAQNDPSLDKVKGKDGKTYSISDALEHNIDWIQIDVGFLSEQEKDTVLDLCKYAVINGSHTAMGEIIGTKARPIIGIPVYDEHTNQIRWAEERKLGILANDTKQVVQAVHNIQNNYNKYEERLVEFARNFDRNGAQNTAQIIVEMLES
ncbi:MAG: glycosyltransferase, partial [Nitrosopumilaceae archaeon]